MECYSKYGRDPDDTNASLFNAWGSPGGTSSGVFWEMHVQNNQQTNRFFLYGGGPYGGHSGDGYSMANPNVWDPAVPYVYTAWGYGQAGAVKFTLPAGTGCFNVDDG